MKRRTYTKLPGKKLFLFVRHSLWEGPDHLLWVEHNLVHEQYKRFYYKDIQAVILCTNRRRLFWTTFWGVLLFLFVGFGLALSGPGNGLLVLVAVWGFLLVVNLLAGPTCDVYLQTAVQVEPLTTLVRVRSAVKVMGRIKAMAERAQGVLDRHMLDASDTAVRTRDAGRASAHGAAARQPIRMADAGEPHASGFHLILIGLLFSLGVLDIAQLCLKWIWLAALNILGLAGLLGLAIAVVVRWHLRGKSTLLAAVGWLSLVIAVLRWMMVYGCFVATTFRHVDIAYNTGMIAKLFLELLVSDHPAVTGLVVCFASAELILGLMGGVSLRMERRSSLKSEG